MLVLCLSIIESFECHTFTLPTFTNVTSSVSSVHSYISQVSCADIYTLSACV